MNKIDTTNLTGQTKYRLNEITKIEDYFNQEITQRKLCSKKLSKYVAAFDYMGKVLIVLSATSGGVFIIYMCECCWCTSWFSRSKFYFNFFFNHRHNKIIPKHDKNKKKKHDKILMLG